MKRILISTLGFALATSAAFAQGANDCASAQAISGTGLFPFTNVGATTDGSGCGVNSDVWFRWMAPASADFVMRTCSQTTLDTVIAVYDGTICGVSAQLGCNDDSCSLQSSVQFTAVAGNEYLFRVGSFSSTTQGSGNIEVQQVLLGGSDNCATAELIVGTGSFPWNNAGMTDDGPASCNAHKDVWFRWTAPSSDQYAFSLCGNTGLDTIMAVYEGTSCPPTVEVGCNDDSCSLQSEIIATLTGGTDYLIRIGSFSSSATGSGFLDIDVDPCSATFNDDTLEENDDCASAVAVGEGTTAGLWCSKVDVDWYMVNVPAGGTITLDVLFTHINGDIDCALYDACGGLQIGGSFSIDDNEQIVYNNTTGLPATYFLNVYVYSGSGTNCNNYDLVVTGSGGGVGTKYCTANSNSTGAPADISASGSTSSAAGDLVLTAAPVTNDFGIFFHGANQAQIPFGNGFQCVTNDLQRGALIVGSGNSSSYTYDNSDAKHSLGAYVGTTRHAQYWFRDPMGGGAAFNTSNGISLNIVP